MGSPPEPMPRLELMVMVLLTGTAVAQAREQEPRIPRTWEVVRRDCRTSVNVEELTLFANGTIRVRFRGEEKDEMRLAELNRDQVEAYLRRLEAEDLSEVPEGREDVLGALVESCRLTLDLPDQNKRRFYFGRFDSLPLGLSRLNAIVNDIYQEAVDLAPEGGLPRNYLPEPGDILERTDGHRFEVVALTSDGRGVELAGLDDPLTLFVALESLRQTFVALVERREFP